MKKQGMKLSQKLLLAFCALGVVLSVIASVIGYNQYKSGIERHYNDMAYNVAELGRTYINPDLFVRYSEIAVGYINGTVSDEEYENYINNEEYVSAKERLIELRRQMEANDIYVVKVDMKELDSYAGVKEDWNPFIYVFDSYHIEDQNYSLGDKSPMNPEFIEDCKAILESGVRVDNYFFSQSEYGYNTSAIIPIYDKANQIVGILGVEIPMTTLKGSLSRYLELAVTGTVLLTILFVFIMFLYMRRFMVKPIKLMTDEASRFMNAEKDITPKLLPIHTRDEIQNLSNAIYQMEMDIGDYISNITKITVEKERIGAELDVATKIQASMLPCIFPAFPERKDFEVYASMNPAKEVGGDFYDFFMVDEDNLAIVVADVSGKGVPAALFMVIGKTLIKDHTTSGKDLGEVFTEVNQLLCESNSEELFITAFVGVLNLKTGEFRYVNAGHEMPFIAKKGEAFKPYKIRAAFVLAGMEGMKYKSGSVQLEPGDKIFQYTDGVTEATDKDNQLFGMERLEATLAKVSDKKPEEILTRVKADIDAFVGQAPQFDDITMLCLEYHEKNNSMTVDLSIDNVPTLTEYIENTLREKNASPTTIIKMNIALDEVYSNIVKFSGATYAKITCEAVGDSAVLTFEDDGVEYNPLQKKDTDTTLSAEEREIGGLGILMVKKSMDSTEYRYENGKNIFILTKKL